MCIASMMKKRFMAGKIGLVDLNILRLLYIYTYLKTEARQVNQIFLKGGI